jgi:hypothetical protein
VSQDSRQQELQLVLKPNERLEFIDWLNQVVKDLHQRGAPGTGSVPPCFTVSSLIDRGWSQSGEHYSIHVFSQNGLIKITLVMLNRERISGVCVHLRYANGDLIDASELKKSDTNGHEMWCNLRFAPYTSAIKLMFGTY